ncbi:MAG: pyruvate kinase [Verrucomicrobia subdivision 3 bacterium]|nr:pyruvate kinase [Limisphaerales bacterium]
MRKTKIIATLGPATDSAEMIRQLIDAGMNIARLNMSHASHDWVRRVTGELRAAAKERGSAIGILMDTQGPAIRTGDLPAPLDLQRGQKFVLTVRGERSAGEHSVNVNYDNFINDISVGDVVLIDNGQIHMKVLAKHANKVECEVLTPGRLGSRRHINLPGVKVSLPPLTEKDRADVQCGLEAGVDFIALSFVREASDLRELRNIFGDARVKPRVIAKIEDQSALKNINDIIAEADAIMLARGDLGIEVPYEELPIIQRKVVKACQRTGRAVIVATHMLESMIQNPHPTRAEITDVANAVYEQADAIMLSGETSVGKYPVKCVEVFDRVARRIERSGGAGYHEYAELTSPRQKLVKSAVVMADELKAEAVLVFTVRGSMARNTAWLRPRHSPIYAFCERWHIANELTLHRGVIPFTIPLDHESPEKNVELAIETLKEKGLLHKGNTAVVIASMDIGKQMADAVQMRMID